MTSIRRNSMALIVAAGLSLPTLASAEQAPSELCDGDKAEQKQPGAEHNKQVTDKSDQKSTDPKSRPKTDDKSAPNRTDKTS